VLQDESGGTGGRQGEDAKQLLAAGQLQEGLARVVVWPFRDGRMVKLCLGLGYLATWLGFGVGACLSFKCRMKLQSAAVNHGWMDGWMDSCGLHPGQTRSGKERHHVMEHGWMQSLSREGSRGGGQIGTQDG
jgi:hypothetical protein